MFSRLSQKTQLFTGKGLIENRFTHTIRVVQIAKSICYGLKLNQDLAEAIAFGHDVGHTPFAHIGEKTLNGWLTKMIQEQSSPLPLDSGEIPPIALKVNKNNRKYFEKYFTFGNDPEEDFFMHGRQSFRFLVFKNPPIVPEENKYSNFTRATLFGIWRHSYKNYEYDTEFKFSTKLKYSKIGEINYQDLTLEAQVVRISDDIAWSVMDIYEGLKNGLIKEEDIRDALEESEPDSEDTPPRKNDLITNLNNKKLSPVYTYFISDIIKNNLEKVLESSEPCKIDFSNEVRSDITALKKLVREKIHQPSPVGRATRMQESMIKSLCDWYVENPSDLNREIKLLRQKKRFPLRGNSK